MAVSDWFTLEDVETLGLVVGTLVASLLLLALAYGIAVLWRRVMDPRKRRRRTG